MAEPFKNAFNLTIIQHMAACFAQHHNKFEQDAFIQLASENLEQNELKARSNQILLALQTYLPEQLLDCKTILLKSLCPEKSDNDALFSQDYINTNKQGIDGWAIMPIADFIGIKATEDPNNDEWVPLAMSLFKEVTKRFSAEFGIRYLLTTFPDETIAILKTWLSDSNQHVRRLISEGSRPRLPWGMQLPQFIENPSPLLPLLDTLKDDDEDYVRRSVANNLNDIAKDHPNVVNTLVKKWLVNASKERNRLIRHACRTLIKQGNQDTLDILGYKKATLKNIEFNLNKSQLNFGEAIELQLSITSASNEKQDLIIDYIVHHQKANGTTSAKTFKWKVCALTKNNTLNVKKKHTIKKITTRVYYPGIHTVDLCINGDVIASQSFKLIMPKS